MEEVGFGLPAVMAWTLLLEVGFGLPAVMAWTLLLEVGYSVNGMALTGEFCLWLAMAEVDFA
jgi:hypothetical protein